MENNIKLEHPVTFRWLMLFALPTIISTIFMNLYSTVDGVFVARLVAKKIGEGRHQEAREDFSLLTVVAFASSILLALICFAALEFLGADDALLPLCMDYMSPILVAIPFTVFGTMVQMSYITVGKAKMGLYLNIIGGVLNIVLDWFFIAVMGMSLVMTVLYFRKYRSVWTETK